MDDPHAAALRERDALALEVDVHKLDRGAHVDLLCDAHCGAKQRAAGEVSRRAQTLQPGAGKHTQAVEGVSVVERVDQLRNPARPRSSQLDLLGLQVVVACQHPAPPIPPPLSADHATSIAR